MINLEDKENICHISWDGKCSQMLVFFLRNLRYWASVPHWDSSLNNVENDMGHFATPGVAIAVFIVQIFVNWL